MPPHDELCGAAFERQDLEPLLGERCYEYEQETGRDLIHECIAKLGRRIADLMGITQRVIRMDSMMIEAHPQRSFKRTSAS